MVVVFWGRIIRQGSVNRTRAREPWSKFSERSKLRKTATKPPEFGSPNRSTVTYYIIVLILYLNLLLFKKLYYMFNKLLILLILYLNLLLNSFIFKFNISLLFNIIIKLFILLKNSSFKFLLLLYNLKAFLIKLKII